MLKASKFLPN